MFWSWFPFPCFWMISGTPAATRKHLKTIAEEASSYEEWYDAQEQIDQINGVDLWANDDKSIAAYDPKRLRQLYDILYERRELDKVSLTHRPESSLELSYNQQMTLLSCGAPIAVQLI